MRRKGAPQLQLPFLHGSGAPVTNPGQSTLGGPLAAVTNGGANASDAHRPRGAATSHVGRNV